MQSNSKDEEKWDLVIEPRSSFFDLKLKEVWRYRDLLWLWVRREYVGAYKQTIFGPLWHFFSPIFGTLIYIFVFGKLAELPTDGVPMFLFYNAGLAIWNFFSGCFSSSSNAFLNNAGIFGKVYFPRLIMPIASIISSLIKFGIQFSFFLIIYFYVILVEGYQPSVGWGLFFIPVTLILLAGTGFGFGILVSSITTKYRDLNMLIGFVMQLLMYATPIIYSYTSVEPALKKYLVFNPLVAPVEAFKFALFGVGEFSAFSLAYSFCWMIFLLLIGMIVFNKVERNFMDTV
ncbi:ABC transporter permease [Pontibacter sp. SGAir0037]|uniref:ABC transporter permease n=1 Tax=Pontibacter sp. SGAir0037 TaxID=2571030 RepID=UPI0010CCE3B2|nr:ABC transporter permease [Pontibacter sp. SGAir0037]QCR22187.1 ABC transporter permease [Pontibacter sp. SGAir0037]